MLHIARRILLAALLLFPTIDAAVGGWDLDWTRLSDGAPVKFLGAPALLATGGERLEVWAWGSDGALWQRSFDGLAWSTWSATPAPALAWRGGGVTSMAIRRRRGP